MGYAVVAGVSPAYGLYTGVFAPLIGALLAGSSLMVITVTNELAAPTAGILAGMGLQFSLRTLVALTLVPRTEHHFWNWEGEVSPNCRLLVRSGETRAQYPSSQLG
jgi:ABC-type Fe3+-siderophore transport system permease subunit